MTRGSRAWRSKKIGLRIKQAALTLVAKWTIVLGLNLLIIDARRPPHPSQSRNHRPKTKSKPRSTRRKEARAAKDFATSDKLRDELIAAGVEVMDGDPLGWDWRLDAN